VLANAVFAVVVEMPQREHLAGESTDPRIVPKARPRLNPAVNDRFEHHDKVTFGHGELPTVRASLCVIFGHHVVPFLAVGLDHCCIDIRGECVAEQVQCLADSGTLTFTHESTLSVTCPPSCSVAYYALPACGAVRA
jgi:hypothetical protein